MSHSHLHLTSEALDIRAIRHAVWITIFVNALLMLLKLFFGYTGHSDALVADGFHTLNDFITSLIVIATIRLSYRKADSSHPWGHGKIETLATLSIGIILLAVGIGILVEGVESSAASLCGEKLPRPDVATMIVAAAAIITKELLYRYTRHVGQITRSSSLIANAWHERADALASAATFIGVTGAFALGEKWRILDPLASVLIGCIIILTTRTIVWNSICELLEHSLPMTEVTDIGLAATAVEGVSDVVWIHTRRSGRIKIIDIRISLSPDYSIRRADKIREEVAEKISGKIGPNSLITVSAQASDK